MVLGMAGLFPLVSVGLAASEPFVLAKAGRATVAIAVVGRSELLDQAASELSRWLGEVCGGKFDVVRLSPDDVREDGRRLVVLATERDFPNLAKEEGLRKLNPEGFLLLSARRRLWILGRTDLAVRHGVFALLEEIGLRWLMPDPVWTVVPRAKDIVVEVHRREEPAFLWRRIWYGWGPRTEKLRRDYEAWMVRNRQFGCFPVHCGHSYSWHVPPRRFFDVHPEWFALVGGRRKPTQLCVTNPEVQRHIIAHCIEVLRREPERLMVSVEPNDGGGYCECPRCRALGSISNQAFYLANVVARAVRKVFPDRWVGLLAYAYHSDPPSFRLEPGVFVEVTTGFRYTKLSFEEQVRRLRELGATLGVYDYFSVYPWDFDLPGAAKAGRVYQLARAIKHYHELGLISYTAESSCNWGPNGLGYWMAAKLMWNPELDPHELVRDFCEKAFGPAALPMRRLYERWARGERFSPRGLKLALLDLKEAYARAKGNAEVEARLDRVAMYLHFLRLWLDYDRSSRWNQWGRLVVAPPEEIVKRGREAVVYARRIMDTGLIHTYPMLFTNWFDRRFAGLKKVEGFDMREAERWKRERTDIPTSSEVRRDFLDDLRRLDELVPVAVEIEGRRFSERLVPIEKALPGAVEAWGNVKRSSMFVESGLFYFLGRRGQKVKVRYIPYPSPPHTVDCRWTLRRAEDGGTLLEGHVKAERGREATAEFVLPESGLYIFDPGTGYWRAAQVELEGVKFVSVFAGRGDEPGGPRRKGLRLWLPRLEERLYFFVPEGTRHFVVGIASGGDPWTTVVLRTADGREVLREKVLAGDQISVIVEEDVREYGDASEMAKHTVLPAHQSSVLVPEGGGGQIWSLSVSGLRCLVELYDVPPFLARHPSELLVPEDALRPK